MYGKQLPSTKVLNAPPECFSVPLNNPGKMPSMGRIHRHNAKFFAFATTVFVFASSFSACTSSREGQQQNGQVNPPYATAVNNDLADRIVVLNNRESAQERNMDRNLADSIKRLRASYKLLPDRRFLMAIADIHKLLKGEDTSQVELTYGEKSWSITYKGSPVGSLSHMPDGKELFELLKNWAKKLKEEVGPEVIVAESQANTPVTTLNTRELFAAFADERRTSYTNDISKIRSGAEAAAWLSAISIDETGVADDFYARALALVACAPGGENARNIRSKCLLADSLHYCTFAREHSKNLPANDTIRLYLDQNLDALAKLSQTTHAIDQTTFLYLMTLARKRESAQWLKVLKEHSQDSQKMALAVIRTACEFAGEKTQLPVGHYLMVAASREVSAAGGDKEAKFANVDFQDIAWSYEQARESAEWIVGDMGKDFEKTLSKANQAYLSQLMPVDQYDNYYRAVFATGIYRMTNSFLAMHGDRNRLALLSKSIATPTGPLANFAPWLENILRSGMETPEPAIIRDELNKLRTMGARPLADFVLQSGSYTQVSNPHTLILTGRRLFELADTRPETRTKLAAAADSSLMYPRLSHLLNLAMVRDGAPSSIGAMIEQSIALRRKDQMISLLKHALLTELEQLRLLKRLEKLDAVSPEALTGLYKHCAEKSPDVWEFERAYASHLMTIKQYQTASSSLAKFIGNAKKADSHEVIEAKCMLASIALSEKKYDAGLGYLSKLEDTEKAEVLTLKARLLEGLGRREEAETWAHEALERFPKDPYCISASAELLWRNGKNADAARLLGSRRSFLTEAEWRDYIGPAFANVFISNTNKMLLAVGALLDQNISGPDTLGEIAHSYYKKDHSCEAFEILTKVGQQGIDAGDLYTHAYRYLKRCKGEKFALNWLTSGISPQDRIKLAPHAFIDGQFELLWALDPKSASQAENEQLWLMRIAACNVDPDLRKKYKPSLIEHFKNLKEATKDLGLYMLGQAKHYPSQILTDAERCKYSFYAGWKMLATGENFFNGTELYHLALETERTDLHEFRWAQRWLIDLMITLQRNPAALESASYDVIHIEGPKKNGDFDQQRRFTIHAFN
ncbi:MAG: hypothetical protein K2Y39_27620 [Candidatus Obscuribacterales bacterium]|nr:hypothetical protein [Candidatus Obscuribacterales bacterium]